MDSDQVCNIGRPPQHLIDQWTRYERQRLQVAEVRLEQQIQQFKATSEWTERLRQQLVSTRGQIEVHQARLARLAELDKPWTAQIDAALSLPPAPKPQFEGSVS